jgi:hypothetical protein
MDFTAQPDRDAPRLEVAGTMPPMTGETVPGDAVVQHVDGRWRLRSWWSVLRIALVVLWMIWAALAWWSAPRTATVEQARADLASGQVTTYEWGDSWERSSTFTWGNPNPPTLESSREFGRIFAWRTSQFQVRYVRLDQAPPPATDASGQPSAPSSDPQTASLVRSVAESRLQPGSVRMRSLVPLLSIAVGLTMLIVLIAGPAPVVGTRWYWFWVLTGVPLGLGLLFWLFRERPWSPAAETPTDRSGTARRRSGYTGFGISFLTALAGNVLLFALSRVVGDWIIPGFGD